MTHSSRSGQLAVAVAVGQCAYLRYIVWIGGDFMSGRFLTAPLVAGVAQFTALELPVARVWRLASATAIVLLGLRPSVPNVLSDHTFGQRWDYEDFDGITDERRYYYPRTGLLRSGEPLTTPRLIDAGLATTMLASGQHVAMQEMVGMFGYAAGPDMYVVAAFYDQLCVVARGPLISIARLQAIAALNVGRRSSLLDASRAEASR